MAASFAAKHKLDRSFWAAFIISAWGAVAIGFYPSVTDRFTDKADYPAPAVLVIHVFAAVGWLALLTAQVWLTEGAKIGWHRKLGAAAIILAPIVAATAIGSEVYSQRYYAAVDPAGIMFFPMPVNSSATFAVCVLVALLLRRNSTAHKRLMYLATSALLVAAYFRWWGDSILAVLGEGWMADWLSNYAGVLMLLGVGAGYDFATRGALHPVYKVAALLIIAGQVVAVTVSRSEWWPGFGRSLLGIT